MKGWRIDRSQHCPIKNKKSWRIFRHHKCKCVINRPTTIEKEEDKKYK
jgi:hypothetical protein